MTRKAGTIDESQLSLFDQSAPPPPSFFALQPASSPEFSPRVAHTSPPVPPAVPQPTFTPPPDIGSAHPVTLASVLAPAVFEHPQADRTIRLEAHVVGYALRRARRRSIGFVVDTEGLSVNAPKWVSVGDIESALRAKAAWILRKLAEQQERGKRLQAAKVDWRDGASIPFLGQPVIVVLDPRAAATRGGALLNTDAGAVQGQIEGVPRLTLHIGLPHTATPAQIRDSVQSWLQRQARRVFEERCQIFTQRLGVRYTRLSLSSAQTRWGSASANGSIRLNWRLIHFALPTIDYVVAHELAHLREMNHSPRFWDVVRSVMPDFEQARGTLRNDVLPVFD